MKLYLAGPMRGYPRYNFDAFEDAAGTLRSLGYEVLSPAEHDLAMGLDPDRPLDDQPAMPGGQFSLTDALRWDINAILHVDAVAVLPGWEASSGVAIELTVARAVGVPVYRYIDGDLEPIPEAVAAA
ncbi:MAG TPA: DUF4406 domain-containing protein [Acidimicrobiales bacterium]|nr:DUF4406 domain-containing protein [Acidimicrobiales bacterium]